MPSWIVQAMAAHRTFMKGQWGTTIFTGLKQLTWAKNIVRGGIFLYLRKADIKMPILGSVILPTVQA